VNLPKSVRKKKKNENYQKGGVYPRGNLEQGERRQQAAVSEGRDGRIGRGKAVGGGELNTPGTPDCKGALTGGTGKIGIRGGRARKMHSQARGDDGRWRRGREAKGN